MRLGVAGLLLGALLLAPAGQGHAASPVDAFDEASRAHAQRLMASSVGPVSPALSLADAASLPPTIQEGLGPGSALRMGVNGIDSVCTASFLVRDGWTGHYYLSTAGHCLMRDPADATESTGRTHPDLVKNRVDVCVSGCMNNGLGLGTYVELRATEDYHPVAYAVSRGVGNDFGLIAVPDGLHEHLRPELPQWGGPTGMDGGAVGDWVVHFGHGTLLVPGVGAVLTRTPADQGRVATLASTTASGFQAVGHVTGGDSGSGAALAVPSGNGFTGTEALGVITHSIQVVGAPLLSGTRMDRGLERAGEFLLRPLHLVLADDPLPRPDPSQAPPGTQAIAVRITSPDDGHTVPGTVRQVRVQGNASFAAPAWPAKAQVQVAVDDVAFSFASRLPVSGNQTWSALWDLAGVPEGMHALRARILDEAGTAVAHHNITVFVAEADADPAPGTSRPGPGSKGAGTTTGAASQGGAFDIRPRATAVPGVVPAVALLAAAALVRRRMGQP